MCYSEGCADGPDFFWLYCDSRRINIELGQYRKYILLSIPCECKLFPILFSDWDRKELIGCIPFAQVHNNLLWQRYHEWQDSHYWNYFSAEYVLVDSHSGVSIWFLQGPDWWIKLRCGDMKKNTMTASVRSLRVALISNFPQECDTVFDSLFGGTEVSEGKAISEAFTQSFHYDKPRISCKNLRAEYINPNYIFGDQKNHHWMGDPWTHWTHCKLAFGQNSIY